MAKITIDDIAKKVNVSKSTVSRYLNGGSVKASTRKKIQEIVDQYDYHPNAFARLNAKQSRMIGVILPTLNSKVTSRVITSIDRYLRDRDYVTIIRNSDHDIALELENLSRLINLGVDGIVLSSISITEEHHKLIDSTNIPVIILAQEDDQVPCIVNDEYNAGKFIGEYIGKKGHKKIGFITVDENDHAVGVLRKQGVLDGLEKYYVDSINIEYSDFSFVDAQNATWKLLTEHNDIDAIICATDRLAFGAYRVLRKNGYHIPLDVSVIGFGGYEESELIVPELTTLMFDSYEMGELAAQTITDMIEGREVKQKQIIHYSFIERRSVSKR